MKVKMYILLFISILHISYYLNAQKQTPLDLALRTIEQNAPSLGLQAEDISDLAVSDMYSSSHNGVQHVYLIQRYKGIPIHNSITSLHITKEGKVFDSPSRFYSHVSSRINAVKPKISETDALTYIVRDLDIPNAIIPKNVRRTNEGLKEIEKTNFTHSAIPVKLVYVEDKEGNLRLAWDLNLDVVTSDDYWSIRVDAINGNILDKHNLTVKCSFDHPGHSNCITREKAFNPNPKPVQQVLTEINTQVAMPSAPNSYKVVALPAESPKHAPLSLVVNPAIPSASPYGWHDTDGKAGAEYQITRGNNVWAYLDRNADNSSDGNEPDGGADLIFDFPYDPNGEPDSYTKAATTNLFYLCNMVHDITYGFGFDEAAGNFQMNNYGKSGAGNDAVRAEAQDGSGTDNANFSTPADGSSGRMQMYLWLASQEETYITFPDSLASPIDCRRGGFGPAPSDTPLEADVVIGNDHSGTPTLGCSNGFRRDEVGGKIVLIDRGTCEFGQKSLNAQKAGAAAVIICNFEDAFVNMGAGAVGGQVTIPAYFTTKSICNRLKLMVQNGGLKIEIKKPGLNAGPDSLDGDFDNGIIAHEFGHGISNRLTGGPAAANCLNNGEQMGEGWSDFMSLIFTAKPGDKGTDSRGIGTYALNERPDGYGIRRRPYSTDMSVNEFTYKNINPEVHDLGEVWTTVLWDLYWALSDKYGYDPTFSNKNAGNNICIQLVFDGMKIQPCRPGFLDGRDAILKADSINNKAANACLIWNVFARRGMGYFAKQGSNNTVNDETESFLAAPICINKVLISKTAGYYKDATTFVRTDVVKPGEEYSITIDINNFKPGAVTNLNVRDVIPAGCTYVPGSASVVPQINGNELVWSFAQLKSLETRRISYRIKSSSSIASTTLWYDDMQNGDSNWDYDLFKGQLTWYLEDGFGVDQSYAWIAEEKEGYSNDTYLRTKNPFRVAKDHTSLLFYHFYNTEKGFDGGLVEVSTDGTFWETATQDQFSLNGYTGLIDYQTFVVPNLNAFSGQSGGFIPTVLDLTKYKGKDVYVRYRFGHDSLNVSPDRNQLLGWVVDNVEYIQPEFYNSQVCLTTSEGDNECTSLFGKGVLADSDKIVDSKETNSKASVRIYPNPAQDKIAMRFEPEMGIERIVFSNVNGQVLKSISVQTETFLSLDVKDLPKGVLIIEARGKSKSFIQKLILH